MIARRDAVRSLLMQKTRQGFFVRMLLYPYDKGHLVSDFPRALAREGKNGLLADVVADLLGLGFESLFEQGLLYLRLSDNALAAFCQAVVAMDEQAGVNAAHDMPPERLVLSHLAQGLDHIQTADALESGGEALLAARLMQADAQALLEEATIRFDVRRAAALALRQKRGSLAVAAGRALFRAMAQNADIAPFFSC